MNEYIVPMNEYAVLERKEWRRIYLRRVKYEFHSHPFLVHSSRTQFTWELNRSLSHLTPGVECCSWLVGWRKGNRRNVWWVVDGRVTTRVCGGAEGGGKQARQNVSSYYRPPKFLLDTNIYIWSKHFPLTNYWFSFLSENFVMMTYLSLWGFL